MPGPGSLFEIRAAKDKECRALLIAGQSALACVLERRSLMLLAFWSALGIPLNEPIARSGPFVMVRVHIVLALRRLRLDIVPFSL